MEPISEQKAREFLGAQPVAHIGVIADGEPYVTPLSFVVEGDRLLFRTKAGRRLRAIEENPIVSVEASLYDEETGEWTSVIAKGRAAETSDPAIKEVALEGLYAKYRQVLGSPLTRGGAQPLATLPHVVVVDIEEISGMSSSGPFSIPTRPGHL